MGVDVLLRERRSPTELPRIRLSGLEIGNVVFAELYARLVLLDDPLPGLGVRALRYRRPSRPWSAWEQGLPVTCLDTDPVNSSLSAITALNATHINLLQADRIDVDAIDELVERVITEDSNFVIDSGAASFVPLSRYWIEHDIAGLIGNGGKRMVVHTLITGGPAMLDTSKALLSVLEQFPPSVELVVWLNEFFGPVVTLGGQTFEQTRVYQENRERIHALVKLERLNPDTFGRNLAEMLKRQLTFAEADQSKDFRIVARQRLRQVWRPIKEQLTQVA